MKPMDPRLTGADLALKRHAMSVTQGQLAEAMAVPQSKVSRWENSRRPLAPEKLRQYLDGLATFGTIPIIVVSHDDRTAA